MLTSCTFKLNNKFPQQEIPLQEPTAPQSTQPDTEPSIASTPKAESGFWRNLGNSLKNIGFSIGAEMMLIAKDILHFGVNYTKWFFTSEKETRSPDKFTEVTRQNIFFDAENRVPVVSNAQEWGSSLSALFSSSAPVSLTKSQKPAEASSLSEESNLSTALNAQP